MTKRIHDFWQEWLESSDDLVAALLEQQVAITLRDAKRVQAVRLLVEGQSVRLEEIEAQAKIGVRAHGAEPATFGLLSRAEGSEREALQGLCNRVILRMRRIRELVDRNEALMRKEMTVLNGSSILLARAPSRSAASLR